MTQCRGNRNLPPLCDCCFHMTTLSCNQPRDNKNNSQPSRSSNYFSQTPCSPRGPTSYWRRNVPHAALRLLRARTASFRPSLSSGSCSYAPLNLRIQDMRIAFRTHLGHAQTWL
jgi:hypothetical protein